MSKSKVSFKEVTAESLQEDSNEKKHDAMLTSKDVPLLSDRDPKSRAEVVMVGVRMTKLERRQLKAMSVQMDLSIQDIMRKGIALFKAEQGIRSGK